MQEKITNQPYLSPDEIQEIVGKIKNPGIRFTVDLYLLDYIKHCFLEDDQLNTNIKKLETAIAHLENTEARKGVEDVLKCLQCVRAEYGEYLEDTKMMAAGDYPSARGAD